MPATDTPTTPADVELVRSFVNTIDYDDGTDALDGPEGLQAWLVEHAGGDPAGRVTAADLALARRLRGALRTELAEHHDGEVSASTRAAVDDVCASLPLRAVGSGAGVVPSGSGTRGDLAQVVAAATRSRLAGSWTRLKICPADDCRWAFFDTSRNRSRRWCSMEVCGNRSKVRAFRDRQAD